MKPTKTHVKSAPLDADNAAVALLAELSSTAAALVATVGNNPNLLENQSTLAAFFSISLLPISFLKTGRHRLN